MRSAVPSPKAPSRVVLQCEATRPGTSGQSVSGAARVAQPTIQNHPISPSFSITAHEVDSNLSCSVKRHTSSIYPRCCFPFLTFAQVSERQTIHTAALWQTRCSQAHGSKAFILARVMVTYGCGRQPTTHKQISSHLETGEH